MIIPFKKNKNSIKLKTPIVVGLLCLLVLSLVMSPNVSRAQQNGGTGNTGQNGDTANAGADEPLGPRSTDVANGVAPSVTVAKEQSTLWVIISAIMSFEAGGIDFLTKGLVTIASYRAYFNEDFVQTGWGTIRDLANLCFILVLMIIALMSILRVEESVVRKLLPRFVFAVLTVNFSFFFCRVVVSFADGLSQGFQPAIGGMGDAIFGYVQAFKLTETSGLATGSVSQGSVTAGIMSVFLLGLLMLAIYFVVAALGVRIIALCVLIILAPVAFLAMILPSTSDLFSKWMHNLFSYAIWGPASLFFLWLSVITYTSTRSPLTLGFDAISSQPIQGISATTGGLMKFIIVMIFLYLGVIAGKLLGNTGGDLGIKFGKGAAKFAAKTAAFGLGGIATATGTKGLFKGFKGMYEDYSKRQQEVGKARAKQLIGSLQQNDMKKFFGALNPRTAAFQAKVKAKEAAERIKKHKQDAKESTKPEIMSRWSEIAKDNSSDALEEKQALLQLAAEKGWLTDNAMFGDFNPIGDGAGHKDGLADQIKSVGFSEKEAQGLVARISSISQSSDSGDKRMVGINDYDANTKDVKVNDEKKYSQEVAKGMAKIFNKGSVESKKVGNKTFEIKDMKSKNLRSAVYAASGIDDQIDSFSGNPIKMKAMMNKDSMTALSEHPEELVDAVRSHIDANKGAPDSKETVIPLGNGEELQMTMGRAKQYVKVVDKARKELKEPEPSETAKPAEQPKSLTTPAGNQFNDRDPESDTGFTDNNEAA